MHSSGVIDCRLTCGAVIMFFYYYYCLRQMKNIRKRETDRNVFQASYRNNDDNNNNNHAFVLET